MEINEDMRMCSFDRENMYTNLSKFIGYKYNTKYDRKWARYHKTNKN
jgi:hypothetical protein